jgi:hypothetical protein
MGYHLGIFATWLRQNHNMSLTTSTSTSTSTGDSDSDSNMPLTIEILSDPAVICKDRKRRPTTRWDHLVKQQSFSMPKVPSRRRLGGDDCTIQVTPPCSPLQTTKTQTQQQLRSRPRMVNHMIKQTSFTVSRGKGTSGSSLIGDDGYVSVSQRPSMVKQASLSTLPRHSPLKMPRLVQQRYPASNANKRSLRKIQTTPCCDTKNIDAEEATDQANETDNMNGPCVTMSMSMQMQNSSSNSSPKRPSRPMQTSFTLPKRPTRSISNESICSNEDEKTDTLSCMSNMNMASAGAGGARRRSFAKQSSFTMPRRPTRTVDSDDEVEVELEVDWVDLDTSVNSECEQDTSDNKTDTLSSMNMPRLVKQISSTIPRLSSTGALLMGNDDDNNKDNEMGGNGTGWYRNVRANLSHHNARKTPGSQAA